MRVLVMIFYANDWIHHLGTDLELAQCHLDRGDNVEILGCDGSINSCIANCHGDEQRCFACRMSRQKGIALLKPRPKIHRLGTFYPESAATAEPSFPPDLTLADAKNFVVQGADLGWGAASSCMMYGRDPYCEFNGAPEMMARFATAAYRTYFSVKNFLASQPRFDIAYIFNGRFEAARAAFRACREAEGLDVFTHERGSSLNKYSLFKNCLPHSKTNIQALIESSWQEAQEDMRIEVGKQFFAERRIGHLPCGINFIKEQKKSHLPENYSRLVSSGKRIVSIFTSSEDEFAGIGDEWKNPLYGSQFEGIQRLCNDLLPDGSIHFFIRVHPNLAGVSNRDTERLLKFQSSNATVIPPSSPVSSYDLLDASNQSLVFGSTMGVEATYWGKPSILAGVSMYDNLDACYKASSHEKLISLLTQELPPKPTMEAIKYGYFFRSFGTEFRYWVPENFEKGKFRGTDLSDHGGASPLRRVLLAMGEANMVPPRLASVYKRLL